MQEGAEEQHHAPYVGVQYYGLDPVNYPETQTLTRRLLARYLNTERVVGVVGSGISINYGYPSWETLATSVASSLLDDITSDAQVTLRAALQEVQEQTHPMYPMTKADRLMSLLELAKRLAADLRPPFETRVQTALHEAPIPVDRKESHDPLSLMMSKLGIRRFVTTNYDTTVEDKLKSFWRLKETPFVSLQSEAVSDFMAFSIGAGEFRYGVFYVHGRAPFPRDDEPGDLVITETDYQRFYLRNDPNYQRFRDAIALTFFGNPLLFVGMGMGEPDLLRPLRQFASEPHYDVRERPIFALLASPGTTESEAELWRFLYARYGVKTLFYPKGDDKGKELCDALVTLGKDWLTWWNTWQFKPAVRESEFGRWELLKKDEQPRPLSAGSRSSRYAVIRHRTARPEGFPSGNLDSIHELLEDKQQRAKVIIALGDSGMGKGGLIQSLALDPSLPHTKRFCASLHFSNDFLSLLEAAAAEFGAPTPEEPATDRRGLLERLREALTTETTNGPNLLLIGGVERLLELLRPDAIAPGTADRGEPRLADALAKQTSAPHLGHPIGRAATLEAKQFFDLVATLCDKAELKCQVVLATAVIPETFAHAAAELDSGERSHVAPIQIQLLKGPDIAQLTKLQEYITEEWEPKELHELLHRHAYLLWVVTKALEANEHSSSSPTERSNWLVQLEARVSASNLHHRFSRTVDAVLTAASREDTEQETHDLLQLLSLFSTPVTLRDLAIALPGEYAAVEGTLGLLDSRDLVLRVEDDQERAPERAEVRRYAAHTVIRSYFIERLGSTKDSAGEVHRFGPCGFSSDVPEAAALSARGHRLVAEAVDRLLLEAEKLQASAEEAAVSRLCRATFALIRGRWAATGVGRLYSQGELVARKGSSALEEYLTRLVRLLNVCRNLAAPWKSRIDPPSKSHRSQAEGGVLYADELYWLFNELALASFCRGFLFDSYSLYRMAHDIACVAEGNTPGQRWFEAELGLGIVETERAQLDRARTHLENALHAGIYFNEDELTARACGHLALVHHLSGDYATARDLYQLAIKMLRRFGNRRALSLFHRNLADLQRMEENFVEADRSVKASIAAAESGRHYDLLYQARVAEALLDVKRHGAGTAGSLGRIAGGLRQLEQVVRFARHAGMTDLEQHALRVQAELTLDQGDVNLANRLALRCLGLCRLHGMDLRLTTALVLLGRVAKERGDSREAKRILVHARETAERQRYQLQVERANRLLIELEHTQEGSETI